MPVAPKATLKTKMNTRMLTRMHTSLMGDEAAMESVVRSFGNMLLLSNTLQTSEIDWKKERNTLAKKIEMLEQEIAMMRIETRPAVVKVHEAPIDAPGLI